MFKPEADDDPPTITAGQTYTVRWLTFETGPPRNPSAILGANNAVSLQWSAPSSRGLSVISGYRYRYEKNGGSYGSWTAVPNSASLTNYTVTGLDDWTHYIYKPGGHMRW